MERSVEGTLTSSGVYPATSEQAKFSNFPARANGP